MTNLQAYVRWRGDISFVERPFNVVDNLVLSALAYVDLDGIVPGEGTDEAITVAAAAVLVSERTARPAQIVERLTVVDESLLVDLAASARFGDALLSDYVDIVDEVTGMQFSALTIRLGDGSAYVAFRGTDNTILGWREDFRMSFQLVPAQTFARRYLLDASQRLRCPIRVGGHSKGGNLAVFAALGLCRSDQDAVLAIYNNDGPGLGPDVRDAASLERINDRLTKIVPEFAVIGMLFEQGSGTHVVASDARGLMQHDLMSWQVEGVDLCEQPAVSSRSAVLSRAFDSWLDDASSEDRREFTDALFGALSAGGAQLTTDIAKLDFGSFESVLLALGRSRSSTRRPAMIAIRAALRSLGEVDFRALVREHQIVRAAALVLVGMFFMIVPTLAVQILGSIAALVLAIWGTTRFSRYLVRFRKEQHVTWRLIAIQALLLIALLLTISHIGVLIVPTNLLLGLGFLGMGWSSAMRSLPLLYELPRRRLRAGALLTSAVVSMLFGIVALSTAARVLPLFVIQAGAYCVLLGLSQMILVERDQLTLRYRRAMAETLWPDK